MRIFILWNCPVPSKNLRLDAKVKMIKKFVSLLFGQLIESDFE
nr:hypothetical protein [uncultured Dysgonomonas sp.]